MRLTTRVIASGALTLTFCLAEPGLSFSDTSTAEPGEPHTWQLGLHAGSLVPRAQLDTGVMAGLDFRLALGPEGLGLVTGFDWSHLQSQVAPLVSPPDYPRSRVDLIQSSHLISTYVGATYDLYEVDDIHIFGGAIVGANVNRSTFTALGMDVPENDLHLLLGAMLVATPLGSVLSPGESNLVGVRWLATWGTRGTSGKTPCLAWLSMLALASGSRTSDLKRHGSISDGYSTPFES